MGSFSLDLFETRYIIKSSATRNVICRLNSICLITLACSSSPHMHSRDTETGDACLTYIHLKPLASPCKYKVLSFELKCRYMWVCECVCKINIQEISNNSYFIIFWKIDCKFCKVIFPYFQRCQKDFSPELYKSEELN